MYGRFIQNGTSIDYTPNADVAAGDIVIRGTTAGTLVGISKLDIPAHTLGALATEGVFAVVKGASVGFAVGAKVYWDAATHVAVAGSTGTTYIGQAISAANSSDATVTVRLDCTGDDGGDGGSSPITPADAITSLTDHSGGSAGSTIPEVEDADTGDALASLTAKVNAILAALRQTGIIAQ